jgi:DNA-binding NarL/FixJ family response regulator
MPGLDGVQAIRRLVERESRARVILISADARDEQIVSAMRAGARGFLLKDSSAALIAEAIAAVHAGGTFVPPEVASRLVEAFPVHLSSALTPRERDILGLVASGLRNKEIALRLDLGEGTVKWHVANVLQKFQVTTRTEAVHVARTRGLLD